MTDEKYGTQEKHEVDLAFFRKKNLHSLLILIVFVAICSISSGIVAFNPLYAFSQLPLAIKWMAVNFFPSVKSFSVFPSILTQMISTVLSSISATMVAAIFGLLLSVLGSRTVGVKSGIVRGLIRAIASFFRNMPIVAWALLLLFAFKQGEFTGFLALFLSTFGMLTRLFLDTFDEIATGPIEALETTGASYWQIVFQAAIPLAITQLISWVLYLIETNIRSATLIGMLTGSGIGFIFELYYKSLRYDYAGLVVAVTVVVVLFVEAVSNKVRRSML